MAADLAGAVLATAVAIDYAIALLQSIRKSLNVQGELLRRTAGISKRAWRGKQRELRRALLAAQAAIGQLVVSEGKADD